jgi:hypothetical protein
MKPWSFRRYPRPYLAADDVSVDGNTGSAVVVADGESFDVVVEGVSPADVARCLSALRDPDNDLWSEVAAGGADDTWVKVTDSLDTLGLLANQDGDLRGTAEAEVAALTVVVDELQAWLRDPAAPWTSSDVASATRALLGATAGRLGVSTVRHHGEVNMPLTAVAMQRLYWAANAPLADAAVTLLLERVSDSPVGAAAVTLQDCAAGPEEPRDAIAALHGVATLLALATRDDAARLCSPPPPPAERISGINLVLTAERAARAALERIGPTTYATALEQRTAPLDFVRAASVEVYYVNRRFVETIVPSLSRRFREPLRKLAFRYYKEEYGHERFERKTCLAAGVSRERLDRGLPMPYHLAYVDNFIALAQRDAVAYLASVMVTEGLPGDPYGINDLVDVDALGEEFAEVFRHHEAANTTMAHDTLARHLLAEVPSVSPTQAATALDAVTYLTELTHRAWAHLYDVYADGPSSRYLSPGLTLALR